MKIFLDANLLIYLNMLTGRQREKLDEFYTSLLKDELYTNLLVVDETLYLSMSKYNVSYQVTFEFLKASILPFTTVIPIEDSDMAAMERYLSKYRIKPSDAVHLAVMEKEGVVNIASEDEEFDKVKEVKRLWLTRPRGL
ncbi:MAG TPA: type II toxin-antitoxin system VapC family toxin [Nitrososphaerales archaeon]|nr:type II toxin-antitoxin system VapC family toxin [Nitrososphaerales archaeon]